MLAEVTGVDLPRKEVVADGKRVPYDYLVIATGARHAYFGHDDWAEFAPGLKTIDDATAVRRRILLAFERAENESDAEERARLLTFVVIGGGATGVEMAGAIAELAKRALAADFRSIDPRSARIILVEAASRVLTPFDEKLSECRAAGARATWRGGPPRRGRHRLQRRGRPSRRRLHPDAHRDLGRRRDGVAGGPMARRGNRSRRPGQGPRRSVGARPSRRVRHRRHRRG